MFQGFSQASVDFMWGIRFNNKKMWFEAHKDQYKDHLYGPMRALGNEVYERFQEAHPELDLVLRVSRIYRDARRLHGRGPYKDHLWLSMERPVEEWTGQPVFWFELTPEHYSYGMGFWMAPPVTMAKLRARIDQDPKPLEQLVRKLDKHPRLQLEGDAYKRPKGEPSSKVLAPWYNKKGFSLGFEGDHEAILWSHDLVDRLLEDYEFLLPYYLYMLSLEGDRDPRN